MERIRFKIERNAIRELKDRYGIGDLDYRVDFMGRVVKLMIRNKKIDQIPEVIGNFLDLKSLEISGEIFSKCNIRKIEGLENMAHLEYLNLDCNKIRKIEGLKFLVSLKELHLAWNKIRRVEGLENLKQLETLDLVGNLIKKIDGLDGLKNLKVPLLHNNWIKKN